MSCVLAGYRSVPLKNSYSEELELASLLVHIEIVNAKVTQSHCSQYIHQPTFQSPSMVKNFWSVTQKNDIVDSGY